MSINKNASRDALTSTGSKSYKGTISMTIYLYVKTHNKTGLKYLGKTKSKDPHRYKGSGADWKLHLKENGVDYTTEIIKECKNNAELNYWGRYYSNLWNVAHSNEWANRIPETGGGSPYRVLTESQKLHLSEKFKGHVVSEETRQKISNAGKGRIPWNKGLTKETDSRVAENVTAIVQMAKNKTRTPWNKGKTGLQSAWNKGLTKDTDARLAEISIAAKRRSV